MGPTRRSDVPGVAPLARRSLSCSETLATGHSVSDFQTCKFEGVRSNSLPTWLLFRFNLGQ